jgi:hypothetical protein
VKKIVFLAIVLLTGVPAWVSAQGPPPPTPVAEADLRDNTIKMRHIELERLKQGNGRVRPDGFEKEKEIRFAETREHFESIQKLQDSIVKTYKTGKKIDYHRISRLASNIRKKSGWLDENLFGAKPEDASEPEPVENAEKKGLRELIIELDAAIGTFVKSPMFRDSKTVDTKISQSAHVDLRLVMKLSRLLSLEAAKFN